MRNDVNRRLILAAVQLEADRFGAMRYQCADAARRVGRDLAARLWAEAGPSEQLQISARWHAARQVKPTSASPRKSPLTSWLNLIDGPLTLECGIIVYSLDTAAKLMEEGAAMRHCVGSIAMQCRLGTKHIFSLRNADGKRLSTLSLDGDRDGDGSRLVVLRQNLALGNKPPPARAITAAKEFIARINGPCSVSGSTRIAVDWTAIDASRQPLACAVGIDREEFGFDIHDADERAATRHFVWPYLPHRLKRRARAIAGDAGVTFADLATAAGVPEAMETWWRLCR